MELNREQIIKALQGHIGVVDMRCEECPYNQDKGSEICINLLMTDSLALIESYEKKIKELTEVVAEEKAKGEMCAEVIKRQDKEIAQKDAKIKRLRADTIDEFADMVKEKMREVATGKRTSLVGIGWLDQIVKELKGE